MKRALVTGSTKGIGLAIAAALIERGWFVYINYAHDDAAAERLAFPKDRYAVIKADVSAEDGIAAVARRLDADGCEPDCAVFNAAATRRKPFGETAKNDWDAVMDTNVTMPFFLARSLNNRIKSGGSLIFIGAVMGVFPHAVSIPYSVSKAAVHMLAKRLVQEFATRGVRVNVVAPGFIETDMQKGKPLWLREKIENKTALRRFGRPEEVAHACVFLIENTYVNGVILPIDGGYLME